MPKGFEYWVGQIQAAKDDHKVFFEDAKKCNEAYCKERSYNIFYSNVNVLEANLLTNDPMPDIQRRFLKRLENDKLKSAAYSEVAKIAGAAIEYYSDISGLYRQAKKAVHNSVKVGRGLVWVEYEPVISQVEGQEAITDRKFNILSLKYDEFLCSSAEDETKVWWAARRHLLTSQDLKQRFNYAATDSELSFSDKQNSQTNQKRGEVWEIWDKSEKKRRFLLATSVKREFLEEQDDPYKLEGFFPYTPLVWLTNGENIIPIPEYKIYRQKAVELDELSEKCRQIEEEVKYVVLVAGKNKETAVEIAKAPNGQVVSIGEFGIENLNQIIGVKPVDGAVTVLDHSTTREQVLKQDIYDLTGISDIIRGVSDPRETAEAQKIKGVFGSLRFQDRQKAVQEMFRKLFRIMTEIICEHWDEETLSEITCTYLPNQLDKANAQAQLQQEAQQAQAAGQQYNPNPELVKVLETPTWDDIMGVMQSDRLRNYTIDIETTATVFDDQEAQTAQINALTQAYLSLVQSAVQLQDPSLIKGFLPIVKMNLANIKISSAISGQLEEALEGAIKSFEEAKNAPPQPTPEEKKMQAEMQLAQMKLEAEGQQKDKEIQGRLQVEMAKVAADKEIAIQKILIDKGKLATDEGELGIKQQEADRKERELDAQIEFKQEEIERGIDINSNISGDVASIE